MLNKVYAAFSNKITTTVRERDTILDSLDFLRVESVSCQSGQKREGRFSGKIKKIVAIVADIKVK